ncbi:MAG: hypothetical protein JNM27_05310, partial [Leptospirales bacterium]|nr:hypothetical protein [Leptospirales bacterium]
MVHTLFQEQEVKTSLKAAWDFFSRPQNLERITPATMKFRVKGNPPDAIYPGLMICYTVSPLFGIPLTWVSEITQVQ